MKRSLKALLCVVLCLAMIFSTAACGSKESGSGETSQGVTDTEIKIGTLALTSGAYAFIGTPQLAGLQACIDRLNANGGVRGRKVTIVSYDDQGDPATGKAYIEKLVEEDKVFMLANIGSEVEPLMSYLTEYGMPIANIASSDDSVYKVNGGHIYPIQSSFGLDGHYLAAVALNENLFGPNKDEKLPEGSKIGVLYTNDQYALTMLEGLMEEAKLQGAEDRFVPLAWSTGTDVQSMIQQWKNQNCKAIIMIPLAGEWMMAAMDDAQWEVPFIGAVGMSTTASFAPDTYKTTRPVYCTIWVNFLSDKGKELKADMANALSYSTSIDAATQLAYLDNNYFVAGYAYGKFIEEALNRFNENPDLDLTWENLNKLIESEPFEWGDITYNYANGSRIGIDIEAVFEYIGHPELNPKTEEFTIIRGFQTLDEIRAK